MFWYFCGFGEFVHQKDLKGARKNELSGVKVAANELLQVSKSWKPSGLLRVPTPDSAGSRCVVDRQPHRAVPEPDAGMSAVYNYVQLNTKMSRIRTFSGMNSVQPEHPENQKRGKRRGLTIPNTVYKKKHTLFHSSPTHLRAETSYANRYTERFFVDDLKLRDFRKSAAATMHDSGMKILDYRFTNKRVAPARGLLIPKNSTPCALSETAMTSAWSVL